jgi:hypothetical protein
MPAAWASGWRASAWRPSIWSERPRQNVIVGRRAVDHGLELVDRLLVALGAEQRAAERLADRGLVGGEVARAGKGDRRLVVVPRFEQLHTAYVQLVDVFHAALF